MKKTIWKFEIPVGGICNRATIMMPKGANIISLDIQNDKPVIWAIIDPKSPKEDVVFDLFMTGELFETNHYREFIGTFTRSSNGLVYHVFKRI